MKVDGDFVNKLVRDNIPEIIRNSSDAAKYKVVKLSDHEYYSELLKKLREECDEFISDGTIEELADIKEVMLAIMKFRGISDDELTRVRIQKKIDKGGFEQRWFIEYADNTEN